MEANVDVAVRITSPGKVLIVDDDAVICRTFAAFLEDCDYVVITSLNGTEAMTLFEQIQPDVVLLDIRMPGDANGIDVLKHINQKNSKVPVIMISGGGSMDDAVNAIRHGAWDYLKKPVMDLDILKHVVDRAFEKMRLEKENLAQMAHIRETNIRLQAAAQEANDARRQAEKAYKAKNEFLKKMSNELRIPAMGVESMIDMLLDTPLSEEQHHYTRVIQSNIVSLSNALTELLDYSRIETGTLNLEKANFNLQSLIHDVVSRVQYRNNRSTDVSFEEKLGKGIPLFLQGDPWRLAQLLYILLENAYKFTSVGTIAVMVAKEVETDRQITLKFMIADTGIGINKDALAGLFEAFTQADDLAGAYSGIGLGLALAKQLATMMDGQIGVSSAVGKGSTFWFTANLHKQPPSQQLDDTELGLDLGSSISHVTPGVLNILLAEKNRDAQLVGSAFLRRLGCAYKTAMTSTQVLEFLEEENFDVLLLDLDLGEMGGLETAGVIRSPISAVKNHHIPIVAMASHCDLSTRHKCQRLGIRECIPKPYGFSQLLTALEKNLAPMA
ncbi:MAG: response regulator [Deltaproteobacteria bacterium]|nr:response regulator [Deltaproteobacteria bacterium]